jgi:hypothetical protein
MDNVKLIRLNSGEDIVAYLEEEDNNYLLLTPMAVFVKRLNSGKTLMMISTWLPNELVEDEIISISKDKVLLVMQPKKELLVYYQKSLDELDGYEIESGEDYDEESLRDASQDTDEEELEEEEDLYLTDLLGGLTNGTKRTIH